LEKLPDLHFHAPGRLEVFGPGAWYGFITTDDKYVYEEPDGPERMTWTDLAGRLFMVKLATASANVALTTCWTASFTAERHGYHNDPIFFPCRHGPFTVSCARQMTGALWRSAFVAMIICHHPLRVESSGVGVGT